MSIAHKILDEAYEIEPNGKFEQANPISKATAVNGETDDIGGASSRIDYFQYKSDNGRLSIVLSTSESNKNYTRLQIYNADKKRIAEYKIETGQTLEKTIGVTPNTPIYIGVRDPYGNTAMSYKLTIF